MVFYVGTQTQFTHAETDVSGGALPPQLGAWSSTNTAVATIDSSGLVSWLAVGETDIAFLVAGGRKFGVYHAEVHSQIPNHLVASPSSLTLAPGDVQRVVVSAFDIHNVAIPDFTLDSLTSTDPSVADVIILSDDQSGTRSFLVIAAAVGSATLQVVSESASANIGAAVALAYRRLDTTVPASDVAKDIPVDHSVVSGALAIAATRAARAHRLTMSGDTTVTLSGLLLWEYAFIDVFQNGAGGHTFTLLGDGSLPPFEWDSNITPDETPDGNFSDSYMVYREPTRCSVIRTWKKVAAP